MNNETLRAKALYTLAAMLFCAGLVLFTQAAPAARVASALTLKRSAVLVSAPPDPLRFAEELTLVLPRPVVPLTIADAVAYELVLGARSLTQIDALRTAQVLVEEAAAAGYDPLLLLALIKVESAFDAYAISPAGAEGLMQLMPETGKWMAAQLGVERAGGHNFDPITNVRLGTRYLAYLERRFGSLDTALTAYNRGPRNARTLLREFGHIPESVRDVYASKVLRRYQALRASYGSLPLG